jgi:uncharacterized protein
MDEAIRGVLEADPRVRYALVFGSSAAGRAGPHSDLDIAVELHTGAARDHHVVGELTARLEQATGRTVDLVLLNEAPPALAYRAFRDGRVVVETDRAARIARQARAVLEYLDFEPVERRCARAVLDATARG